MVILLDDLIKINSNFEDTDAINRIKKDTGKAFKKSDNGILSLHSFDFGKKILYHPENISAFKNIAFKLPNGIILLCKSECQPNTPKPSAL